jgi:hypothetical protein
MAAVSWQVGTSSVWFYLTKVAEPGTLSLERQGSLLLSRLRRYITPLINELALLMMGRRIAPAADDTARLRRKFKKRRFQMIADTGIVGQFPSSFVRAGIVSQTCKT